MVSRITTLAVLLLFSSGAACSGNGTGNGGTSTPAGRSGGASKGQARLWRSFSDMDPVWSVASTAEHVWAGTPGGLLRYSLDGGNPLRVTGRTGPGGQGVVAVQTDDRGQLWALSDGGIGRFDNGAWSRPTGPVPDVGALTTLAVTENDTVWVGGLGGLASFRRSTWLQWTATVEVTALARPRGDEDGVWVGTTKAGIWHVGSDKTVSKHAARRGNPCEAVHALEAGDDELWAICERDGGSILARFRGNSWQGYSVPLSERPIDLGRCRSRIVLLTETGLWRITDRDSDAAALAEGDVELAVIHVGGDARPEQSKLTPTKVSDAPDEREMRPRGAAPGFAAPDGAVPAAELASLPPVLRPVKVSVNEGATTVECDERGIWIGTSGLGITRIGRRAQQSVYRTLELVVTDRPFSVAADGEGNAWFLSRDMRAGVLNGETEGTFEPSEVEHDTTAGWQILAFGSRGSGAYALGRMRERNLVRIYQHVRGEWVEMLTRQLRFGADAEGEDADAMEGPPAALAEFTFFEVDPRGKFWIGVSLPTEGRDSVPQGVVTLDIEVEEVTYHGRQPRGPGAVEMPNDITVVDFTEDGEAWLGGLNGVIVLKNDGTIERFSEANGLIGDIVNDLAIDSNGIPWVATPAGLGRYQGRLWRFFLDDLPEGVRVESLAIDSRGELWAGGNRGGVHYDGNRWEMLTTANGLISNRIRSVHVDGRDRVWFVTDEGISLLSSN